MFKTAKQETSIRVINVSLPHSVLLKVLSSSSFPVIQAWTGYPLYLQLLLLSLTPFSPQHFLSSELLLFLCVTVVLFALAPGWEPARASWAAGTCCSVSELLQEPHRAKSQISQPSLGRAVGPFYPVTNFCPILAKGKVLIDGVCNQF